MVVKGNAIIDGQIKQDQFLVAEKGRFTYVGSDCHEVPDIIVQKGYIAPSYIDIHIHGSNGFDVMEASEESIAGISQSLAAYGVTGFLATTVTASVNRLVEVLDSCRRFREQVNTESELFSKGADLLGIHLEGPWINRDYKGAQNEAHIIPPLLEDAKRLVAAGGVLLKMVTLAPEQPGANEVIEFLHNQGIKVSVGHSDASYETVKESISFGLTHVTHCYNAMRALHHREPGVAGAALYHDELTTELIADGVHVHPVVMSLLYRFKRMENLVLISDGIQAVGMENGEYELGGLRVFVSGGQARLADGTLAGSTLTLDQAVKNMVNLCGVPIADAVTMASKTPANVLGIGHQKGRLASGYDADFLLLDEELNVLSTYKQGISIYDCMTNLC